MTNPAVQYGSQITADTTRGPSPNQWGNCPWAEIKGQAGQGRGVNCLWTDFDEGTPGSPTTEAGLTGGIPLGGFGSTGSTLTAENPSGGASAMVMTSAATDNLGGSIFGTFPAYVISDVSPEFWFEARIKVSSIITLERPFILGMLGAGAMTIADPLIAAGGGLKSTADFVGFQRVEADTTTLDTTYQAGTVTQVQVKDAAVTIAADTYIKLGMYKDPSNVLAFYSNGLKLADTYTIADALGTTFPSDIGLRPVLAYIIGAGVASTITIDWLRVAQLGPLDE